MVSKSHGPQHKTREKFRKPKKLRVTDYIKHLKSGDVVALVVNSSSQKGRPFRRFHGLTGKVLRAQGRSFVVEIYDGNMRKQVIARPEHIRKL